MLTKEQEVYLQRRIQSLRSKQKSVGIFRQGGIQQTIEGMRAQLKNKEWTPPPSDSAVPSQLTQPSEQSGESQ